MKTLVFFGATGNLFTHKILPSLGHLLTQDGGDFSIVAIGRRSPNLASYQQFLLTLGHKDVSLSPEAFSQLFQRLTYIQSDIKNGDLFLKLAPHLEGKEVFFYLATLPSLYPEVLRQLKRWNQTHPLPKSIALEKPFGSDEESFLALERELRDLFPEERVFYVDHYLGKSTVLSLIILKAENLFIEKLLSRHYLKEVRIAVCEEEGVEERAQFYEETGALRDIFQNHLLQLLTLFAIDIPPLCEEDRRECQLFQEKVAQEKVRLLEKVRLPRKEEIILGQYQGYREAVGNPSSSTETLIHIPIYIENARWRGVPFRMFTGKKMAEKRSFIEVIFHSVTPWPNRLVIEIQPEERIDFYINVKTPSIELTSVPAKLNFSYFGTFGAKSPQAYQKIIHDFLHGERTLFPNSAFIRRAWQITDALKRTIERYKISPHFYPPHTLKGDEVWNRNTFSS